MQRTDVLVIGGGQAGLAASFWLTTHGIDHAVLERGRIGERWRSATWDSLRLQTPRWQSRLPGWSYSGPDPDGYMATGELVTYLERYARSFSAPLYAGIAVHAIAPTPDGYVAETSAGPWRARAVILATGYCDTAALPRFAHQLSSRVCQLVPTSYRRPEQLPAGGVLVVGASASGVLLADELRAAGRDVTLAVGGHTRLPRHHLGRDIYWWLDAMGILTESVHATHDLAAARRQPSMQLVGDASGRSVDLHALQSTGVRLVGRAVDAQGETLRLADDLAATTAAADARARRLVGRIDAFASARGLAPRGPAATITPVNPGSTPTRLSLRDERITTVIWATGFRRDYSWLHVPGVLRDGELVHDGGVTPAPGLYALGLRFQRRRNSSFLDGVGDDARIVVDHLVRRLDRRHAA